MKRMVSLRWVLPVLILSGHPVLADGSMRLAQLSDPPPRVRASDIEPPAGLPGEPPRPPAPPSVVEQVLKQILVERDLDEAQALLSDSLVQALNQVENPAWTARVYALLSAVAVLGGDDAQASRLALRAVALDPAVRLEPQLGEAALGVLANAKKQWQARAEDAVVTFLELPANIQILLDGQPLATPGSRLIRAGDHLVQVRGATGVLARAWITVEAGAELVEPPPMAELRRALQPAERQPAVSAEELEQLMETGRKAQGELRDVATDLELDLETAKAARQTERVACLAQQEAGVRRLLRATEAYKQALQRALDRDEADEVRHQFRMIGLARDEAVRLKASVEQCFDRPERGAETEVRVIQAPPAPALGPVRLETGVSSAEARVPLAVVPEAAPRHTLLRPPPVDLWSRVASPLPRPSPPVAPAGQGTSGAASPGAAAPATGKPASGKTAPKKASPFRGDVWVEGAYDSNPTRATEAYRDSRPVGDTALEPAFHLLVTPTLSLEGGAGFLRARYPLRLGTTDPRFSDLEIAGQTRLSRADDTRSQVRAGLEIRRDLFRIDALGDSTNQLQRTAARVRVDATVRVSSGIELELDGEGLGEMLRWPTHGTQLLRTAGNLGVAGFWRVYPYSVVAGDLLFGGIGASRTSIAVEGVDPELGVRSGWFVRARVGVDGQLAKGLTLSVRAGVQPTAVTSSRQDGLLSPARTLVGFGRLGYSKGVVRLGLELERSLMPAAFADAQLFQGAKIDLETTGTGRLRARVEARAGLEQLLNLDLAPEYGAAEGWNSQRLVGGELAVSYRVGSLERLPLRVSASWLPSIRWGVPGLGIDGAPALDGTQLVHQAFLGANLEW